MSLILIVLIVVLLLGGGGGYYYGGPAVGGGIGGVLLLLLVLWLLFGHRALWGESLASEQDATFQSREPSSGHDIAGDICVLFTANDAYIARPADFRARRLHRFEHDSWTTADQTWSV